MLPLTLPGGSGSFIFNKPKEGIGVYHPSKPTDPASEQVDLNQLLAPHQGDTFVMRAGTDFMMEAGIIEGDLLVVDRTLAVDNGKVVIALVDGQLLIRRYQEESKSVVLSVDSGNLSPLIVPPHSDQITIWGVVTHVIHQL